MRRAWTLLLAMGLGAGTPGEFPAAEARIRDRAEAAGQPWPLPAPELRVFKARHAVELWSGSRRIAVYRAGLGHRGLGDKRREGDHLTPEGRFYVCVRNRQSAFHRFLGISYPEAGAAARGLAEGLLNRSQADAIRRAQDRKACPPWNTRLGGTVGLHGGGASSDWTWGCIALEDPEIEELWLACPLGTPVLVAP